eukprot:573615_1
MARTRNQLKRLLRNSIYGFKSDTIHDYQSTEQSRNRRLGIVDYERLSANLVKPGIEVAKFECAEGCDPSVTSECLNQWQYDAQRNDGESNPFVRKFECDNVNYS